MSAVPNIGRVDGKGAGKQSPRVRLGSALIASVTAVAVAITAGVTAAGAQATTAASTGTAVLEASARGLMVGIPLAVGLYARGRPAHARFGTLLLAFGGLWFLSSLSTSSLPALYSIGRVAGWVAEVGLAYIALAFPQGRLTGRSDRMLISCSLAVIALYLVSVPLVGRYPAPSPWASCYHGCPGNAFMALDHQPAFVDGLLTPIRELLTAILFLLVAGRLAVRIGHATPLMRRTLTPVLAAMIVQLVVFTAFLIARRIDADSVATRAGAWAVAFATPAVAIGFLVGLARWHLFVGAGIRAVNGRLRQMPGLELVRDLLADAFHDSQLQIASWSGGQRRWVDASARPLAQPAEGSGRWLTEVRDGSTHVVAIVHDVALRDDTAFIESAAAAASVAFASDRVAARTAAMVRELKASRSRILAAADSERQRIERDLHDGAQQRLVALCIHLELAAERAAAPAEADALRALAVEVEQALDEIRSLTRGIYPSTLLEQGLGAAVRSAALRSPVPTSVNMEGLGEYPPEITAAVYFCCVEALQNVAKHAASARSARIVLRETGSQLCFSVTDDGPGFRRDSARVGAGMVNMRDRVTSVGGRLSVDSRPGHQTRVSGRIPLSPPAQTGTDDADGRAQRATALQRASNPTRRRDHAPP
jgi:signal transduction histidine kinase